MSLMLGINAGGTYTDAVLFDKKSAKSLTTKHNLTVGITNACNEVLEGTTLVTLSLADTKASVLNTST